MFNSSVFFSVVLVAFLIVLVYVGAQMFVGHRWMPVRAAGLVLTIVSLALICSHFAAL